MLDIGHTVVLNDKIMSNSQHWNAKKVTDMDHDYQALIIGCPNFGMSLRYEVLRAITGYAGLSECSHCLMLRQ